MVASLGSFHRKGGLDVPVLDGGTGASTASAGLAALGHATQNHAGIPGVGGGVFDRREQIFTPALAQTVFTLAATPTVPNDTSFYVNMVKYIYGLHYTVVGNQVTWLPGPAGFALDTFDMVEIIYFV